jgi:hypothetical protein
VLLEIPFEPGERLILIAETGILGAAHVASFQPFDQVKVGKVTVIRVGI